MNTLVDARASGNGSDHSSVLPEPGAPEDENSPPDARLPLEDDPSETPEDLLVEQPDEGRLGGPNPPIPPPPDFDRLEEEAAERLETGTDDHDLSRSLAMATSVIFSAFIAYAVFWKSYIGSADGLDLLKAYVAAATLYLPLRIAFLRNIEDAPALLFIPWVKKHLFTLLPATSSALAFLLGNFGAYAGGDVDLTFFLSSCGLVITEVIVRRILMDFSAVRQKVQN